MPYARAQLARDLSSATLIVLGVAVLTWGAWQIDPAVGGIVGGLCLLALGVALGFGEVGRVDAEGDQTPDLSATVGEGLTPPDAGSVGVGPESTSSAPTYPLPDMRPATVTLPRSRYLGVNGAVDMEGDAEPSVAELVELTEQAAVEQATADI